MGYSQSDQFNDYDEHECASMLPDPWLFYLEKIRIAGASRTTTIQVKNEWGETDLCGNGC